MFQFFKICFFGILINTWREYYLLLMEQYWQILIVIAAIILIGIGMVWKMKSSPPNRQSYRLSQKNQWLKVIELVKSQLEQILNKLTPQFVQKNLLTNLKSITILQTIKQIQRYFDCFDPQFYKNIRTQTHTPSIILKQIKQKLDLICQQHLIGYDYFIEMLAFYQSDTDVQRYKDIGRNDLFKLLQKKIESILPQIPSYLDKQKMLDTAKKLIKKKCLEILENLQIKKQITQNINIKIIPINQTLESQDLYSSKISPTQLYNNALIRYRDDQKFMKQYQNIQISIRKIMGKYQEQIRNNRMTSEQISTLTKMIKQF